MEQVWENLEVPIAELPKVEEVHFQRHPVRFRTYRYMVAVLWFGPLLLAGVALSLWMQEAWTYLALGAASLVAGFAAVSITKGYPRRSYALREKDLTYRQGWLFTSVTTAPFNRIQHTEVAQGPLERKFKLCTLHIYTAGGSSSDLSIPGLESDEAAQLRDYVARKATQHA